MDPGKSSEAFIKALKGKETSASKIELATEGWHSKALYLPGKHSVIADWVIQSLCEGGADSRLTTSAEARHWQLLAEIITSQNTKSTNSWLTTILARRTILPILASTILKLGSSPDVIAPFAIVYRQILPLALPKATDEFVLNCFWAPLEIISSESTSEFDPLIIEIWTRGLEAFRSKFGQVKDKKRIISLFLDERLAKWARAIQLGTLPDELRAALRTAGDILLFGTTDGLLLVMEHPPDSPSTSKSTSSQSNHFFAALKQSIERDDSHALISLLPSLLHSFTKSVQRSHLDLSQILSKDVTSETRVRVAATYFLTNCLSGPLAFSVSTGESKRHMMETRLGLFQVMTEEGYLDSEQSDARDVLQSEIEFAVGVLQRDDTRDAALEILTIILKQDFDLINPVAPKILHVLSKLPSSSFSSCHSFLSSLLGFHCKTRTLQVHIHGLVDCLVSTAGGDYVAVSCGPLFASAEYAKELHQAIRLFLTPSQIPHVVKMLTDTFNQLWGAAKLSDSDEMDTDTNPQSPSDIADAATALSLLVRLVEKVFSAISMLDSTTQLYLHDLHDRYCSRDLMRQLVSQLETASTPQESSKIQVGIRAILRLGYCMDKLSKNWELSLEPANNEPQESLTRLLGLQQVDPELLLEAAAAMLHHMSSSPLATASNSSSSGSCGHVVSLLLNHIEQNLEAAISNQTLWSGQSAYVPSPSHLVVALVDMLLGRWLYVLEQSAPDECLQRLGKVMIRLSEIPVTALGVAEPTRLATTSGNINATSQFKVADVVWNTFSSGEFWEMRRLRVALMSTVVELTAEIDKFSTLPVLANPQMLQLVDHDELAKQVACYRSMLYFPLEYFTRASKPILSSRAITLDFLISATAAKPAPPLTENEAAEWRLVLRTFIDRTMVPEALMKTTGVLEHLVSTTGQHSVNSSSLRVGLESVTLRILSQAFSALASSASQDSELVRPRLQNYIEANVSSLKNSEYEVANNIRVRGLLCLLDAFVQGPRYSGVESSVCTLLDALHQQLESWLTAQLDQILNSLIGQDEESLTKACLAADVWRTSTRYRRWKGDLSDPIPFSAAGFLPSLSRVLGKSPLSPNPTVTTLGIAVFRLLLEVLQDSSDGGIESAIACFVLLHRFQSRNKDLSNRLIGGLSESLRQWSADEYSMAVGLVSDFYRLSSSEKTFTHSSNLGALFHLSAVLIVDAPEGTGKQAHSLLQQTLLAMLRSSQFGSPTDVNSLESSLTLVHEATAFIQRICNEKPSFLRDIEMGHIFTILHTVLAPPSSAPTIIRSSLPSGMPTSSTIYSAITNTLISLVRNQRDLIRTHFPDFTQLLCLLLSSLKTVHEALGSKSGAPDASRSKLNNKSIELIQSGLPWWVSACGSDPNFKLNEKDAKQLNRLLMSLSTKTFGRDLPSRRPRGSERASRADSLASSFSNYATFVLIAYVRTVTDSYHIRSGGLTTLGKSTRRELEEGISELCGMIGENRRDWVYQSLTSDGRSLFKTVWARYEKHRYTGTG